MVIKLILVHVDSKEKIWVLFFQNKISECELRMRFWNSLI